MPKTKKQLSQQEICEQIAGLSDIKDLLAVKNFSSKLVIEKEQELDKQIASAQSQKNLIKENS